MLTAKYGGVCLKTAYVNGKYAPTNADSEGMENTTIITAQHGAIGTVREKGIQQHFSGKIQAPENKRDKAPSGQDLPTQSVSKWKKRSGIN